MNESHTNSQYHLRYTQQSQPTRIKVTKWMGSNEEYSFLAFSSEGIFFLTNSYYSLVGTLDVFSILASFSISFSNLFYPSFLAYCSRFKAYFIFSSSSSLRIRSSISLCCFSSISFCLIFSSSFRCFSSFSFWILSSASFCFLASISLCFSSSISRFFFYSFSIFFCSSAFLCLSSSSSFSFLNESSASLFFLYSISCKFFSASCRSLSSSFFLFSAQIYLSRFSSKALRSSSYLCCWANLNYSASFCAFSSLYLFRFYSNLSCFSFPSCSSRVFS